MMGGWKTWAAAIFTAGLGVLSIINGDVATGAQQIAGAVAMIGIGHKIEKAGK